MDMIAGGANGTRLRNRDSQSCLSPRRLLRQAKLAGSGIIGRSTLVFALALASPSATGAGRPPQVPQQVWTETPEWVVRSNEFFEVILSAENCDAPDDMNFDEMREYARNYGYNCFYLGVKNLTDDYIYVVWQKTFYIKDGDTYGYFYSGGDLFKDVNNPKPDDVVFPNSRFSKMIKPSKLLEETSVKYIHGTMPESENGIFITLRVMSRSPAAEMPEKLTTNISKTEK